MRKVLGYSTTGLGLALIVAAILVSWVVAPRMAMLPGDTDVLRVYGGTASVLVNPTSLTGTTFGPGILRDVPITVRHHTEVARTDGQDALVHDQRAIDMTSFNVADFTYTFAVDRKNMGPAEAFGAPPHQGLTFNWPMDTMRHDYTGWVVDSQESTPVHYVGEGTRGGADTYMFTAHVPESVIRDPHLLAILPATMTKQQIMDLTPSLQLSEEQLLSTSKLLNGLPDPVPMSYTYREDATYWVDPETGIVIDAMKHEVRTANFVVGDRLVPATPIMDMTYQATPTTLAAAVQDAKDGAAQLRLIRTTLPLVALIVGVVLSMLGVAVLAGAFRKPHVPASGEDADLYHLIRSE
jgi:hypothetical protein